MMTIRFDRRFGFLIYLIFNTGIEVPVALGEKIN